MEENNKMIEKYRNLIVYFTHLSKQTDVPILAETSKDFVVDFISKLAQYEKKDRTVYEKMIDEVNGDKTKFVYEVESKEIAPENIEPEKNIEEITTPVEVSEVNKENEYIDYVTKNVYSDNILKEELGRLEEKLVEDFENPNPELIEVWIKNYKDFVVRNNLDNDYMVQYMMSMFKKYDKNNDYINDLEELYERIDLTEPVKEEEKEETKTDETKTISDKVETKEEDKKTSEPKTEGATVENTDEKKVEGETPTNVGTTVTETKEVDKNLSNAPIKIVSTKKPFFNRTEKLGLGVAAIACLSTPFITPAVLAAYMFYKLRKNHKYKNKELEEFLKANNFTIKDDKLCKIIETGEIKEEEIDGKIVKTPVMEYPEVTEQTVGKVQYEEIKKQLMQIGALKSGLIPDEYKKNRLLQTLMNLKPIQRINNIRKKRLENYNEVQKEKDYFQKKETKKNIWEIIKDEANVYKEDIEKGMRRL